MVCCPNCGSENVICTGHRTKFIPRFSEIAIEVVELMCEDCGCTWTEEYGIF